MKLDICPNEPVRKLYEGVIRNGSWGDFTSEAYEVYQCLGNEIAFLHPFPRIDYEGTEYRELVNKSAKIESFFDSYDRLQPMHLSLFADLVERGMVVADCGCGGGSLLDYLSGLAKQTVAIEPLKTYHDSLKERGHHTFSSIAQARQQGFEKGVDLALSVHVIEHTENPVEYLRDIRALLRPGGKVYVHTPNLNDILMKIAFDAFAPFNFRTQHNYYFTDKSLQWLGEKAGFEVERTVFHHEFGMANALYWLRDKAPRGYDPMEGIDSQADTLWRAYCEGTGQATNVGVVLRRPQ